MLHTFFTSVLHDSTSFQLAARCLLVLFGFGLGLGLCTVFGLLAAVGEVVKEDEDRQHAPA